MFLIGFFGFLAAGCASLSISGPIVNTPLEHVRGWERRSNGGRVYQEWRGIPYAHPPYGRLTCKAPKLANKWNVIINNTDGPIVNTPLGQVRGWERLSRDGRVYQAWTGIPYAQPPIGKLRFKAPKPANKWTGILNATADMPVCLQASFKTKSVVGVEDCLYLSVYRPKFTPIKLPVLFHVHGGAFLFGSIGPRENADYLMDEDVILVNIHYRLGALGFMGLGDKVFPGNFGLKDQVMALKWVKQNIAAFGGDPDSVTVFGESAGGASSHILLKTPAAEGLVHRALSDSGTINHVWSLHKANKSRAAGLQLAENVGCSGDSSEEILECMQKANSSMIVYASGPMTSDLSFVPCIEPVGAEDAVATEDLSLLPSKKPWINSNTNGEFTLIEASTPKQWIIAAMGNLEMYLKEYVYKFGNNLTPKWVAEGAKILERTYFTLYPSFKNMSYEISKSVADASFPYPSLYNLGIHEGPKWYYYLEYVGELSGINKYTGKSGPVRVAGHAEQHLYQFNFRSEYPGVSPKQTSDDYKVSKRLIKYLVNFAYYDNPTPDGAGMHWNQFTGNEVLRVANSQADFQGDQTFFQQFENILNIWVYVIGWP